MAMAWLIAIPHACLLLFLCAITAAAAEAVKPLTVLTDCPKECGGVAIPYPFGIGEGCYRKGFDLDCIASAADPPKPRLKKGNIEVVEILTVDGLLRINQLMANNCYASPGKSHRNILSVDLSGMPYKLSNLRNKFVAVGCDTVAYLTDWERQRLSLARFSTGCTSNCKDISYVENYTCSGVGCCETSVPRGLQSYSISISSFSNHQRSLDISNCSFGFLADIINFNFTIANLSNLVNRYYYPVSLEWSIGSQTCAEEGGTACVAANSVCYDAVAGVGGYRCNCSDGFTGNPYLESGCQDIDECHDPEKYCISKASCENTNGNYTCICPEGMEGDGRPDGSGCTCLPGMEKASDGCKPAPKFPLQAVVLGTGFTVLFLIAIMSWLFWMRKKAQTAKFLLRNGGDIINQKKSTIGVKVIGTFTRKELKKATDNYSKTLGEGTYGAVYKGTLPDKAEVAIKKSKGEVDEYRKKQFINELSNLTDIKQRNIVKFGWCCLETEIPLLVYEFVPNGNLFQHIHKKGYEKPLSLEDRVRIATETARALNYMHTEIEPPIFHRDIKSANILLTENLTAKVADFGPSQLVPSNEKELVSLVVGTRGYLDPEFNRTETFTDKSDVYSFGMVLVELLMGKEVSPNAVEKVYENADEPNKIITLADYFISCMKAKRPKKDFVDKHILDENPHQEYIFEEIAQLALGCLEPSRDKRPSMKDVLKKLEDLAARKLECVKNNDEDTKPSAENSAESLREDSKKSVAEDLHEDSKKDIDEGESSIGTVLPFRTTR